MKNAKKLQKEADQELENLFQDEDSAGDLFGSKGKTKGNPKTKGKKEKAIDDDEGEEKSTDKIRSLRYKIMLYLSSAKLAPKLKKAGFDAAFEKRVAKMSADELEDELTRIQHYLANLTCGNVYEDTLLMASGYVEAATYPKLNGLTNDIRQDEPLLCTLEEIRIKHPNLNIVSPEKRLLLILGGKIINRYSVNKATGFVSPLASQAAQNMAPGDPRAAMSVPVQLSADEAQLLQPSQPAKKPAAAPTQPSAAQISDKDLLEMLKHTA